MATNRTIPADWSPPAGFLENRTVLVTGAASGIGKALCQSLASLGATPVMLDKDLKGLEQAFDEIVEATGIEPALYPLDLEGASPEHYNAMADILEKEFGRLDGLVHNAAFLGALTPLDNIDAEFWYRTLQVNLNGPFLLTMACLGLLGKSDDASVVFTSDEHGRHGKAYWGAYGVSKAGAENLMQTLADELEANTPIRVNSLDTGPVLTGLRRIAYPSEPSSGLPKPADVVNSFLYLLGPDSKGVTGEQFSVG